MITLDYLPRGATTPLRVCAYIRVSSDDEDQESSFAAQNDFFRSEIDSHPGWESAGIYADYAKSGTQIKGRLDFQRMMRDAGEHRFNYILTKSILKNEIYVGDKEFGKNQSKDIITGEVDENVVKRYVRDHHEGLVDRETWNAVQRRREGNRQK